MTKDQVQNLIDRLADKTLSFGQKVVTDRWGDGSMEIITSERDLDENEKM